MGSLWPFSLLALGWSWLFWLLLIFSHRAIDRLPVALFYAAGGLGPALAAIVLTYRHGPEARRDYWHRIIGARRIGGRWYAALVLVPLLLTGLAALIDRRLGGSGGQLEAAAGFLAQPLTVLPMAFFFLLFGPLPEEIAWRGYALDRLQARRSALDASVILGALWSLWHVPQFFVKGTFQYSLGAGSAFFWMFLIELPFKSILYTWIYNNTGRSTLSAILFHFTINFTGELFALSPRAEALLVALWIVCALAVAGIWGSKTLTRARHGVAAGPSRTAGSADDLNRPP